MISSETMRNRPEETYAATPADTIEMRSTKMESAKFSKRLVLSSNKNREPNSISDPANHNSTAAVTASKIESTMLFPARRFKNAMTGGKTNADQSNAAEDIAELKGHVNAARSSITNNRIRPALLSENFHNFIMLGDREDTAVLVS